MNMCVCLSKFTSDICGIYLAVHVMKFTAKILFRYAHLGTYHS